MTARTFLLDLAARRPCILLVLAATALALTASCDPPSRTGGAPVADVAADLAKVRGPDDFRGAEAAPAAAVPENLLDLVTPDGPRYAFPHYINRVRILEDGTAVLCTWQDPLNREGPEPEKHRVWIRGEGPSRDYGTRGVPEFIDSRGMAWYHPFATEAQHRYVGTDGRTTIVRPTASQSRYCPQEDAAGRIWIQESRGFHCWDGRQWSFYPLFQSSVAPENTHGYHGLAENTDGSVLAYPVHIGTLFPGKGITWLRPPDAPMTYMLYFPSGGAGRPIPIQLGSGGGLLDVAPLPQGAWLIRRNLPEAGPEIWFPPEANPAGPDDPIRRIRDLVSDDWVVREKALQGLLAEPSDIAPALSELLLTEWPAPVRAGIEWLQRSRAAGGKPQLRYFGPFDGLYFLDAWSENVPDKKNRYLIVKGLTRDPAVACASGEPKDLPNQPLSLVRLQPDGRMNVVLENYPPNRSTAEFLPIRDVLDWPSLLADFRKGAADEHPSPAKRIWVLLSPAARKAVQDMPPESAATAEARSLILRDLNGLLGLAALYDESSWAGVPMNEACTLSIKKMREGRSFSTDDQHRFNRGLLEAALPEALAAWDGPAGKDAFGWSPILPMPDGACVYRGDVIRMTGRLLPLPLLIRRGEVSRLPLLPPDAVHMDESPNLLCTDAAGRLYYEWVGAVFMIPTVRMPPVWKETPAPVSAKF